MDASFDKDLSFFSCFCMECARGDGRQGRWRRPPALQRPDWSVNLHRIRLVLLSRRHKTGSVTLIAFVNGFSVDRNRCGYEATN